MTTNTTNVIEIRDPGTCEGCGQDFDELLVKGLCRTCGLASFTQAVEDAKTDQLLEDALGPEQPCITCGEPTGGDRAVCIDCDREQEQDAKATRAKWALRDLEGPTAGAMRVALSEVLSEATVASWRDLAATEGLPAKDRTLCASVAVLLEGMRGDAEQVLSLVESRSAARSAEAFFRT